MREETGLTFVKSVKEGVSISGTTVTIEQVIDKYDSVPRFEVHREDDYRPRVYWSLSEANRAYKRLLSE